ncbi:MAG: FAD-dependent monooxygenase [Pseudomonadota bacterium]
MARPSADVLIAGSGLVGLAVAAALRQAAPRLSVILLDPAGPPGAADPEGPGLRVSAIAPASQALFERIGAWQRLPASHVAPFTSMRVWDAGTDAGDGVHFAGVDLGTPVLGAITDNNMLSQCLYERLADDARVSVLATRIEGITARDGDIAVRTATGDSVTGRLLIGADGRESGVRRLSGIATRRWSHDQLAVVAHLASEHDHDDCALQRFLPDGPLALLPLADRRVSLVWSTTPDHARSLLAMDDATFAMAVTEASDGVLGALTTTTPRVSFPLVSHYVDDPVAPRTVLVGDAAHAVHPLAGQGANLGFDDADCLATLVAQSVADGADIGDPPVLRRYRRARKADNAGMVYGLDVINRLFARDRGRFADLRRAGMRWFDTSALAKQLAAGHAMGRSGDAS